MDDAQLFTKTLNDLHARSKGDEYELLRAAALLRQLLLDSEPLVHRVNRSHKMRIRFIVAGDPTARQDFVAHLRELDLRYLSLLDRIDPEAVPDVPVNELTLDQFLGLSVVFRAESASTVHDIIDLATNVLGGVHLGAPSEEQQEALSEFEGLLVGGTPASVVDLRPIIRIVLRALAPLRQAVQGVG